MTPIVHGWWIADDDGITTACGKYMKRNTDGASPVVLATESMRVTCPDCQQKMRERGL